jgi:serine/threonine protein kinase
VIDWETSDECCPPGRGERGVIAPLASQALGAADMNRTSLSLESLFHRALNLSAGPARDAFLTEIAASDPLLHGELVSLLHAHETAGTCVSTVVEAAVDPAAREDHGADAVPAQRMAQAYLQSVDLGQHVMLQELLRALPAEERMECARRVALALLARTRSGEDAPLEAFADTPMPRVTGFMLKRRLGAGGLGEVYEAIDERLSRIVAVKVLHPHPEGGHRQRVLDEARKAAGLRDPAIVTIHAVVEEDACPPAIVMEYVEGYPLDKALVGLPFAQRARVLQEICRALAHAHQHGTIHRDLKPDNILVTPDLKPKILDFGLAVSADEAGAVRGGFEGTPAFASPEQAAGQPLTPASDIFSLGSLMFKVLTGRTPFNGRNVREILDAVCTANPPFPRDVANGVPEDLQAITLACLSWNPLRRPSAEQLAVELGRYLAGEPVRLRPALYTDILRRRLSEYAHEVVKWRHQGMISQDEADRMEAVHRRILAEEDHWIVDARRITLAQTALYTGTWLVVVAAVLLVWLVRNDMPPVLRWSCPLAATGSLLGMGLLAERRRESLAAAAFLAGAVLSIAPTTAALLSELRVFAQANPGVTQLLPHVFTNEQVLAAFAAAAALSGLALARLKMTGFAWTLALLGTVTYLAVLMLFNWLNWETHIAAMWCLPLVAMEVAALGFERFQRIRWALPFHLVALGALIVALDVMATSGRTLSMLGFAAGEGGFLDPKRLETFSLALNGSVFLGLMLLVERARSLDLRRIGRWLEVIAIPHWLMPLYFSATNHRDDRSVLADVGFYIGAVCILLLLGSWRGRWRLLLGAMGGVALGCHLLVDLDLVPARLFVVSIGLIGLLLAIGTYLYLRLAPRAQRTTSSFTAEDHK